jgi:hypothetical protein
MNQLAGIAALVLSLVTAPALAQGLVTFNFDTAPGGGAIASGTILNSVYAVQGLTLSRTAGGALCNSGNIYANNDRPGDFTISSAPNVVSQCSPPQASDVSETNFGAIRGDLTAPASQACINVRPDGQGDQAVLRAYDVNGSLIGTSTSAAGAIQTLCVVASNIRRLEFTGSGGTFVRLDDLAITFSGAAPVLAPVPALSPPLLALLLAGLGIFGLRAMRRR